MLRLICLLALLSACAAPTVDNPPAAPNATDALVACPDEKVVFSPRLKIWWHECDGQKVRTGYAHGGGDRCRHLSGSCRTEEGNHRVLRKFAPGNGETKVIGCQGSNCPGIPYLTSFFEEDGQITGFHPGICGNGSNCSHGCVRVSEADAIYIFERVPIGTKVVVLPYE